MQLEQLVDALPEYAKDLKLNYSTLVRHNADLTPQQLWGTMLACAYSLCSETLTLAVLEAASLHLTPQAADAAKGAAAIIGMNNIYYRFLSLVTNEKYNAMPPKLRMNIIRTHGVDPRDFDLWALAVSVIHGCGKCINAHERLLREKGLVEETIVAVVRIAAVVSAIGGVLVTQGEPVASFS
jgi:alkyl hydroperoxide reductase subunit D